MSLKYAKAMAETLGIDPERIYPTSTFTPENTGALSLTPGEPEKFILDTLDRMATGERSKQQTLFELSTWVRQEFTAMYLLGVAVERDKPDEDDEYDEDYEIEELPEPLATLDLHVDLENVKTTIQDAFAPLTAMMAAMDRAFGPRVDDVELPDSDAVKEE